MTDNETRDTLIAGGHVVDPLVGYDGPGDILLSGGFVSVVGEGLSPKGDTEVVDATGCYVFPGLIDMHVHLRQPGREDKETIRTGTMAAAAGGFTSVVAKANTFLVMDNPAVVEFVLSTAEREGYANVWPVGSITEGLKGFGRLSEVGGLKRAGVVALSDDGVPVVNSDVMARALEYSADFDVPVITHSEDYGLSGGGSIDEGTASFSTGLAGIPPEAEEIPVARDIELQRAYGGKLHVAHVSAIGTLERVRRAKEDGLDITCETAPHYLTLTADRVAGFDTSAKMNPPLRKEEDRQALVAGVADGTVDCIVTDHAPHTVWEKAEPFETAPFGVVGLETSVFLIYTYLVKTGVVSVSRMVELMSANPARRLGLEGRGTLAPGSRADVTVFDPRPEFLVASDEFKSRGKNSPYVGEKLSGKVVHVWVNGRRVVRGGEIIEE
ncbi:MAG: dihydroorotase [Candidatus Coatesbacteria bacterium]|nr:MAG: dihydroorotase [Candidatus Coatesbacteria bacterium]